LRFRASRTILATLTIFVQRANLATPRRMRYSEAWASRLQTAESSMARRCFNFAALCSANVFGLLAIAYLVAGAGDPWQRSFNVSQGCRLSLFALGFDSRLVVFDSPDDGPYYGGIIYLFSGATDPGAADPNRPKVTAFGDTAGIYYRLIRWRDGTAAWTLSLNLLYPMAVASLLPLAWLLQYWRRRRQSGSSASHVVI
jgi:hypothetical protein